jgi:hypothetical protein
MITTLVVLPKGKDMGVGIQLHPLEKEHTSGCWVLLYNQQAYSDIQDLKPKYF